MTGFAILRPVTAAAQVAMALAILGGCTAIPMTSIPRIMSLEDPKVSAGNLELAVRIDDSVRVRPGTAKLTVKLANPAQGVDRQETFVLQPINAALTPGLRGQARRGFAIERFRIADGDRARIDQFKREGGALRAGVPGKSSLNLKASAGMCRPVGGRQPDDVRMTFFFRVDPSQDYITLIDEQHVTFKKGPAPHTELPTCP